MSVAATVLGRAEANFDGSVERLKAFLRFPSVGTDPAHDPDTRAAAEWLAGQLRQIDFRVEVAATGGQPCILAHRDAGPNAPRLLYYGHYDVQPAEPLDLWQSPPFEPATVDGPRGPRIVARGAVDDKGQVMTFVEAFRAWHEAAGGLPVSVTILVEGEEESGSPNLEAFLEQRRAELGAEVCVVSDTNMLEVDRPAITTSLRGIVYVDVTVEGPSRDLHSGMYGGAVLNPLNALTRVLGGLHDDRGRVQIPGFYDRVVEVDARPWAALGLDEAAFLAAIGLTTPVGEAGRSLCERLWSRPTCDLNGICGGYTGAGLKTVIPARASAKLSCRLVPDQEPDEIIAGIRRFFADRLPPDARLRVDVLGAGRPIRGPTELSWLGAARTALTEVFGVRPALVGCGVSIPVVASLKRVLGLDTLLVGFGLEDDRVHSANEKFELACYRRGILSHALMLARFAEAAARR